MNKTLFKRNAQGKPIFWNIIGTNTNIIVKHGLVNKQGRSEEIKTNRNIADEYSSLIQEKRKQGYKELKDLDDNAPEVLPDGAILLDYLNNYLPKNNTHADGAFIPMLCKTLEDNKPFEKRSYFGQWKINGERCIITATKEDDIFGTVTLRYRSREGIDWTNKLSYLDQVLIPKLGNTILEMMVEEGVGLDGELYIPGYKINEINSFIKNVELPQHYQLQYWCYDICIDDVSAIERHNILDKYLSIYYPLILTKEEHLENKDKFVLLPIRPISSITDATEARNIYIDKGFEGLVIRDKDALYQFGGKRNNSMLKYKKVYDGYFTIVSIKEDKRGLPIFTLQNDINEETFDATINIPQTEQRKYLTVYENLAGKKALVEYRERSGIKEVPFHSKIIKIIL